MRKISVFFAVFAVLIFIVSCGDSSGSRAGTTADDGNSGKDTVEGELNGECYPNKTCNKGLVCDTEKNICVEENTTDDSDENEDSDTTSENDSETDSADDSDDSADSEDDSSDSEDDSDGSTADDDSDPADPCDPNPCIGLDNSTETCKVAGTTYQCGCESNYYWDGHICGTVETQSAACTGLPYNALWNSVSEIIQTWDDYLGVWVPSSVASYNETPGTNQCKFKCKTGFKWNGSLCLRTAGSSLGQICTGQNSCYSSSSVISCSSVEELAGYAQDAYYAKHGVCVPHDLQSKTIADDTIVKDSNTKLEWQQTGPTEKYSWEDAVSYCENLEYGGQKDWRLPSPHEFLTIADRSKYDPPLDTVFFPNMKCSTDIMIGSTCYDFWTSKEYSRDSQEYAFVFSTSNSGGILDKSKTYTSGSTVYNNKYAVICVRGNELPVSSFKTKQVGSDTVVVDSVNGLMWQQTYETNWIADYCSNLTYAGYSDWRLPNINELATLAKYDKTEAPFSDFPDMPEGYFYSSTKNPKPNGSTSSSTYSSLNFYFGGESKYYIRCVRNAD